MLIYSNLTQAVLGHLDEVAEIRGSDENMWGDGHFHSLLKMLQVCIYVFRGRIKRVVTVEKRKKKSYSYRSYNWSIRTNTMLQS